MSQSNAPRKAVRKQLSRQRRPKSFWVSKIEEFVRSNLTIKEFCFQKGLAASTFLKWRKKLKSPLLHKPALQESFVPIYVSSPEDSKPVEIPLSKDLPGEPSAFTLYLSDHLRLSIGQGFHGPTLKRIVHTLSSKEGSSCF